MGITILSAEFIIQEHRYKPLPETVHLLGRQTICFDYETACRMMLKHGITPVNVERRADETTRTAMTGTEQYISDSTFFGMLGVKTVYAIDHSDYEGADIIVNLNRPIEPKFEGFADFIFGGSVLDNVFDPACYMRNITRMLRPGGRLIDINSSSFGEHPYVLISPAWYYDYCVINGFAACSLYVSEGGPALSMNASHIYGLDVKVGDETIADPGDPASGMRTHVIMIAEKGEQTSWDQSPSQDQYRGEEEWKLYRRNLEKMNASPRPRVTARRPTTVEASGYAARNIRGLDHLGLFDAFSVNPPRQSAKPGDETERGIRIVEATYGLNQRAAVMPRIANVPFRRGNVTAVLAMLINGQDECDIELDVTTLGDPAPGLPKDLTVLYYNAGETNPRLHTVHIPEEAHGKRLKISVRP